MSHVSKETLLLGRVLFSQFEAPMTSRILTLQYKPDGCLSVSRVQTQIKGHLEVRQPWPASSEVGEPGLKILADSPFSACAPGQASGRTQAPR